MVEVVIDRLGAQGDGVARLEETIYVPLTLAGERVEIGREGQTYRLDRIVTPSPDRVTPLCQHFGACGGCQIQHLAPAAAARWKHELVRAALANRGFDDVPVAPTRTLSPGTRRRARLTLESKGRRLHLGFHSRHSHRLIDIKDCPALAPPLAALLTALRTLARTMAFTTATVTLTDGGVDLRLDGQFRPTLDQREAFAAFAREHGLARLSLGDETALELAPPAITFGGVPVRVPAGGFLQASAEGEAALVETVLAHLGTPIRLVDLFSGCGTFTFPLARLAPVRAFETDKAAIDALNTGVRGAAGIGLKPIKATRRDLFREPLEPYEFTADDTVVIDPPRDGADAQSRHLAQSSVRRIIAVSCNPATFARDARLLVDGGFHLTSIQPIDQFPWSAHVELVACLER